MTEPRSYPPGVTCWIDIERDDPQAAADFYAGLFGWEVVRATPPDAPQAYFIARLDGRDVAGIGGSVGDFGPQWKTYVAVEDCDATTAAARAAGATITREPVDAGPGGRWSELADPQGAVIRLWQARRRLGAQAVNEPGAWNFSDLRTPDVAAAKAFYGPLFGWRFAESGFDAIQVPGYGDHLAAGADPGIRERQAQAPEGFADVIGGIVAADDARWTVTFTVADRDAVVSTATGLSATVVDTAEDDWTRKADLLDPSGAPFTVSQFTPPDSWS